MLFTWAQMGLSAAVAIALTALLRAAFSRRLPRRAFVALWDVIALRLLVPFFIPWRFSPQALFRKPAQITANIAHIPAYGIAQPANMPAPDAIAETVPRPNWPGVLLAIWTAGALMLGAVMLWRYAVSMRAFAQSLPDSDPRVTRFLLAHPTRRRVRVRVSAAIASPLSYGILRPVILLPKGMDRTDDRALSFVLLHELSHIRAMDAARKLLLLVCVCAHWMNPAVYAMLFFATRDMELLCDERVLAACGRELRRDYARTLLDMEERRAMISPVSSPFSQTAIEERIKTMKNLNHKGAVSALLSIILVCVSCVALATGAPEAESSPAVDGVVPGTAETYTYESPIPLLGGESWDVTYSKYEPYGLSYDEKNGRLTFGGKVVRFFEDMVPFDENTNAGTVCQFPDGEVDVYAVRDLSAPIERNADGSYNPFEAYPLTGLRAATQEEFDEVTKSLEEARAKFAQDTSSQTVQESVDAVRQGSATSFVVINMTSDEEDIDIEEAGIAHSATKENFAVADEGQTTYVTVESDAVETDLSEGAIVYTVTGESADSDMTYSIVQSADDGDAYTVMLTPGDLLTTESDSKVVITLK